MDFGLSEDQKLLVDSVSRYLKSDVPLDRTRSFVDGNEARANDVWAGLSGLGVPGLLIAEEYGGVGLGLMDAALLAETLGYHIAPVPFVASAVIVPIAIQSLGSDGQKQKFLPKLADGSLIAGAGLAEMVRTGGEGSVVSSGGTLSGKVSFVLDFEADVYLIADNDGALYMVEADAAGLTRKRLGTIDRTRHLGELTLDNVAAERLDGSDDAEARARVLEAGRIILAADTLGAAQNMLDQSVAYAKERVQFGRLIGSFQAVKHMCAEMAAELEPCRSMVWYAAHAFDALPEESRLTACHTKAHVAEVGTFIAKTSTEVHGGIGFTDELGLHYWFKRIGSNRQLLGSPESLREEAAKVQQLV